MLRSYLNGRVTVWVGDITRHEVDAIVNAANSSLLGGGGVDGAIHRRGGPEILAACRELRRTAWPDGLPTGEVAITTAGNLPARQVIHTPGPIYGQERGREAELLAACYTKSLELAAAHGANTVAFPAISTGVYGYPREAAARVASTAIEETLARLPSIREVRLVFFLPEDAEVFEENQVFNAP
jgi:O-acetyl-ADP-ribose deacetylase (regulator of RNase III)